MKTVELTKAAEELEDRLKGTETSASSQTDDEGLKALLHKSMDLLARVLPKVEEEGTEDLKKADDEPVVEPTVQEKMEKSEKTGQEDTYKSLVDSKVGPELEEMTDATPVLAELIDTVAKSQGQVQAIYKSLATQDEKIDALVEANTALCKGFEALYTSVLQQPRRPTSPGFMVAPDNTKTPESADLRAKVLKAIQDGTCESYVWSWFDTRSDEQIRAALPPGVLD